MKGDCSCVPTQGLSLKDINNIKGNIKLFIRHEMANFGELKDEEIPLKRLELLRRYADGKVLTKILMGITAGEVSWRIYSERSYWN